MRKRQSGRAVLRAPTVSGRGVFTSQQWEHPRRRLDLSGRQLEIVQCIFDDWVGGRIALELGISDHTVHTHVERLYRKLGVNSRCELIVRVVAECLNDGQPAGGPGTPST